MSATVTLTDVEVRAAVAAYVHTHHGYACTPESVELAVGGVHGDPTPIARGWARAEVAVVKPDPPDKPAA